jgi:hypothetical protein
MEIVCEFYANIYNVHGDTFLVYLQHVTLDVTLDLVYQITGVPQVQNQGYPYSKDVLLSKSNMIRCLTDGIEE